MPTPARDLTPSTLMTSALATGSCQLVCVVQSVLFILGFKLQVAACAFFCRVISVEEARQDGLCYCFELGSGYGYGTVAS